MSKGNQTSGLHHRSQKTGQHSVARIGVSCHCHPFPLDTETSHDYCASKWQNQPQTKQQRKALTQVLVCQTSVAGHVDKEDIFASILLKRDVLLPIDGEGSVIIDGAAHATMAVCLKEKKTRE